jgi:hypothetical protein
MRTGARITGEQRRTRFGRNVVAIRISRACAAAISIAALAGLPHPAKAATTPVLRLDGIGPLHLGMTRTAALGTDWLAARATGCELAGPPLPITYRFTGTKAPRGIAGVAEFNHNRPQALSFTHGVRTSTGVTVGRTTIKRMVARYRQAGFGASAQFVETFQGTFVTVSKGGRDVLGGFGEHGIVTSVGIPAIPVCE